MTTFTIPLSNDPQVFAISLAGIEYNLICRWNDAPDGGWVLDIEDSITNLPIAANIPLITGADCLAGLEYIGINGKLLVYTDGNPTAVPTFENLGVESNLYFQTEVADNG